MESIGDPSLSVATLVGQAVAVGFGSKVVVSLYHMNGVDELIPHNAVTIDDNQMIRAVTFIQFKGGPLCVVTAGDAKYINIYNLDPLVQRNPDIFLKNITDSSSETKDTGLQLSESKPVIHEILPCYRYGPHSKRITSMVTEVDGCIIFADKFGEVYRMRLNWNPSSQSVEVVDGDGKTPVTFLFQHFSIISTLYLSSPIPPCGASLGERVEQGRRRIFSCDKDHHCRVSHYPEVYNIEQFLWPKSGGPAVITCVEEIPFLGKRRDCVTLGSSACESSAAEQGTFSYYVTGNYEGEVLFWVTRNDLSLSSSEEPFQLISTYRPGLCDETTLETGAVLSVVYLACGCGAVCGPEGRYSCNPSGGVLVAYEKMKEVVFFELSSTTEDRYEAYHSLVCGGRIQLEQFPVAMVRCDESTALILNRSGGTVQVRLCAAHGSTLQRSHTVGDKERLHSEVQRWNTNTDVELRLLPHVPTPLEEDIKAIITLNGTNLLNKLSLFSQWQKTVSDPRTRKKNLGSGDSGEDVNADESCESNKVSHGSKDEYNINKRTRSDSN